MASQGQQQIPVQASQQQQDMERMAFFEQAKCADLESAGASARMQRSELRSASQR